MNEQKTLKQESEEFIPKVTLNITELEKVSLDFLVDNYNFDFPMTAIARESNVSYNSLKVFFPYLVQSRIIVKTRRIGKSDYYKLNLENQFVKNLMKLDWSLVEESMDLKKEKLVEA